MLQPSRGTALPLAFTTEGGRIAYDDTGGAGPLLVALPGPGTLRSDYQGMRSDLVRAGYRVVAMDLRGMGDTDVPWRDYTARSLARDVLALTAHIGVRSAILMASSSAASAAVWAAHDSPGRVGALVLLAPVVRPIRRRSLADVLWRVGLAGPWRSRFWVSYWRRLFVTAAPPDHPETRTRLAASLAEPGRGEALQALLHGEKDDLSDVLPRLRAPALVVAGTRDPRFIDPEAEADWLAQAIRARTLVVEGAGHYPHVEMPGQVGPAIVSFLAGI
jgi:pimeloyl-ACP methyl ester carboxylesterase